MNLQIGSYNKDLLLRQKNRTAKYLETRNIEVVNDVSEYSSFTTDDIFTAVHIKSIVANLNTKRKYKTVLGKTVDSHIEIEKLGVGKGCLKYTTVLSLEDSLDLILHRICGCNYDLVFNGVKDYSLFSRAILTINYDLMGDLKFENLLGIDDNLDRYLVDLKIKTKNDYDFLNEFFSEVIREAGNLAEFLSIALKSTLEEKGIKIIYRSKGLCSYVFTSSVPINDTLELKDNYSIELNSYEAKQYTKHIDRVVRVPNVNSW